MSRQQTKLALLAAAALGLILPSALAVQWFKIRIGGLDTTTLTIDLRSMTACDPGGCLSASLSKMQGLYPTAAMATFWASLAVSLVVALQAMSRIFPSLVTSGTNAECDPADDYCANVVDVTGNQLGSADVGVYAPDGSELDQVTIDVIDHW